MNLRAVTESKTALPAAPEPELNAWDIFLVLPSAYVLLMLSAEVLLSADNEARAMFKMLDTPICLLFLGDFVWRLWSAPDRLRYLKWGWVDLVASIPAFDLGRWGRLLRLFRIARAIRSAKHILMVLRRSRKQSIMLGAVFLAFLLIQIGALLALEFEETAAKASITTPQNALWWAVATVTTVGYGDMYPVTPGGRIVAGMLMFCGIGLFSSIAAVLSSWLVQRDAADDSGHDLQSLAEEVRRLQQQIAQLTALQARSSLPPPDDAAAERQQNPSVKR